MSTNLTVLSSLERPTLLAQVARHLPELINRARLRPGDTVPSEVQIGKDLQVSRGSVREAYRPLSALGILEIEASGNPLNALLLGALRSPVEASSRMHLADTRGEAEIQRVIDAHDAVVTRIVEGDPVGAAAAMCYHFDLALVHVQRQSAALQAAGPAASEPPVFHRIAAST